MPDLCNYQGAPVAHTVKATRVGDAFALPNRDTPVLVNRGPVVGHHLGDQGNTAGQNVVVRLSAWVMLLLHIFEHSGGSGGPASRYAGGAPRCTAASHVVAVVGVDNQVAVPGRIVGSRTWPESGHLGARLLRVGHLPAPAVAVQSASAKVYTAQ